MEPFFDARPASQDVAARGDTWRHVAARGGPWRPVAARGEASLSARSGIETSLIQYCESARRDDFMSDRWR